MIDRAHLLAGLKWMVRELEGALLAQATDDGDTAARLRKEWEKACEAHRTAATYVSWRGEQVTQASVAWVLGTVFLRFCEDNRLIDEPFLAGPGERLAAALDRQAEYTQQTPHATGRDWILAGIDEMARSPVTARVFDKSHNPMWRIELPHDAAQSLLKFWRRRGEDGEIFHDFTDSEWDSRFLGDLYQDLSDDANKAYALIQTPDFIEEFLLDHTLTPAIEEFGLDGLRLIDPTCGSGHFLLGAFSRILNMWRDAEPRTDDLDLIRRALLSVHGVDKNPYATAIARFRLLVAAMKAGGIRRLREAPDLPIVVATGDSLLHDRGAPGVQPDLFQETYSFQETHSYATEDVYEYTHVDLLGTESYHVVVGNPPYITPKDKREAEFYRTAYSSCTGAFALTVPFTERFFRLARLGNGHERGAGHVGMLLSNSFMKRDFGRKLIEEFLPTVELTHLIDTSGAYIPGHGTPTVAIVGRRRSPSPNTKVFAVVGLRGEPEAPEIPGEGRVWRSIQDRLAGDQAPDDWTQIVHLDREVLRRFPWNLADPATTELLAAMGDDRLLGDRVLRIGYVANSGADDLFTAPAGTWRRAGTEAGPLVDVFTGSGVRDWTAVPEKQGFLPLGDRGRWLPMTAYPGHHRRLWPYRTVLRNRPNFSGKKFAEAGRLWNEWHQVTPRQKAHSWSIIFTWVASHPSFAVLKNTEAVSLPSAPVIKLPTEATDQDVVQLCAVLNSSAAAFWLKQHSRSKGQSGSVGGGELWNDYYEFTPRWLNELPLPPERAWGARWSVHAEKLNELAQTLINDLPAAVIKAAGVPSARLLDEARERWARTRRRMIALQEELDWEIYERYGVVEDTDTILDQTRLPEIEFGERVFEIVLARKAAEGAVSTTWFERHRADPIIEPPGHWPREYRDRVLRRISLIAKNPALAILERPEHKRRWIRNDWEAMQREALREWLLDRLESRELWYDTDGRPVPRRAEEIVELFTRIPEIREAVELYSSGTDPIAAVHALLDDHQLPHTPLLYLRESGLRKHRQWQEAWELQRAEDAQGRELEVPVPPRYVSTDFLRTGYWRWRGPFNIPNERFIGYPEASLYGWAGWGEVERAEVLAGLVESGREVIPLLAGIWELLPWLRQWHGQVEAQYGAAPAEVVELYVQEAMQRRGLSPDEVLAWRPPKPKRGRPRKRDT